MTAVLGALAGLAVGGVLYVAGAALVAVDAALSRALDVPTDKQLREALAAFYEGEGRG